MLSQIATLTEIEMHWNLVDLISAHEALDLQQEVERKSAEQMKRS